MSETLVIVKTLEEFKQLQEYLADKEFIAFDTETTGLEKSSKIIGVSVAAETDKAYYVIFSYWDKQAQTLVDLPTVAYAKEFHAFLATKDLIMHNALFDCQMVENNFNVQLMPKVHTDTMVLAHLLDENRSVGLKELGTEVFGENAKKEQIEMKESITANGGSTTKGNYELYKADADLIAKYGAKDAILTLNLFYHLVPQLYEQGLDKFFYDEESMPLLKGPTYHLNTTGLRVDLDKLAQLERELIARCAEQMEIVLRETHPYVKDKYPGTGKTNKFNPNSSAQLSWLMFDRLEQPFTGLTKEGRDLCKALNLKLPYTFKAQREFRQLLTTMKGRVWKEGGFDYKKKKATSPKKIKDWWVYAACNKQTLTQYKTKYKWAAALLDFKKNDKILNTYVLGIQERQRYNIIRPEFKQTGTTSGRYSSKNPNFQNLPRDDKRVKECIIAREGKTFVGADYSQLEPRVFASLSNDERLLAAFKSNDDFYSTIGMEVFDKYDCTPKKEGKDAFGEKYKQLRDIAKVVALSSTYGTTAHKMAPTIGKSVDDAKEIIDNYFERFPGVRKFMLTCHNKAKKEGRVVSLFGRPRRMPEALNFVKIYGQTKHEELPYQIRNVLNLAVNHVVQSTGASVMNRAAIMLYNYLEEAGLASDVKMVLQVHDSLILECPTELAQVAAEALQYCMENVVNLPGVSLEAVPKIGTNLAEV